MQSKKLSSFFAAFLYTLMMGLPSSSLADDTEIYTDSPSSTGIANILFNLDTSGSMGSKVDENNNGVIDSGERSRIAVLKDAMNSLLDSMPALNVGIMRYHYHGGPILFPVANLNLFACDVEGNCPSSPAGVTGSQIVTSLLASDSDDVTEENTTTMNLGGAALDIGQRAAGTSCTDTTVVVSTTADNDAAEQRGWDPSTHTGGDSSINGSSDMEIPRDGSNQQLDGLWFRNVNVPKDATITDARLIFVIDEQQGGSTASFDVDISSIDPTAVNAAIVGSNNFGDDVTRPSVFYPFINATAEWTESDNPSAGEIITTSNMAALVQATVNDPDWVANDNMMFLIEDDDSNSTQDGRRTVEEGSTGVAQAPKLSITYQSCAVSVSANIRTGVRFQAVRIPQGVTINSARIDFTATAADDITSGTAAAADGPDFIIKMENSTDAAPFSTTSGDLSSRTYLGTSVGWDAGSTPTLGSPNGVDWTVDTVYPTPDLKTMMQTIVNDANWCGGNDMVFMIERLGFSDDEKRSAYSRENDATKAPVLVVDYEAGARDAGAAAGSPDYCATSTVVRTVSASSDDAEENDSGGMDLGSSDLEMIKESTEQQIGIRFTDIPIAQGSNIVSAKLTFTVDEVSTGAMTLDIHGQKSDDASTFASGGSGTNDISDTTNRPRTTNSVTWSPPDFDAVDNKYSVSGLEDIIKEIVGQGGWSPGNDLAILISGTGNVKRVAKSFDINNGSNAPVLEITFQGDAIVTKQTVRDRLKDIVDSLVQRGGTPIAASMVEAAKYFRGEEPVFGRQRGEQASSDKVTQVSHFASYDANGSLATLPSGCTAEDTNSSSCVNHVIDATGTPKYKSPIIAECQTNYLINLTDGGGYYTGSGKTNSIGQSLDEKAYIQAFAAQNSSGSPVTLGTCNTNTLLTDGVTSYSGSDHNECAVKLAKFLNENDQIYTAGQNLQSGSSPIDGLQNIRTYNIGFNLCGSGKVTSENATGDQVCCTVANHNTTTGVCSSPLSDPGTITMLKAMSDVGDGDYFNANTADELLAAFQAITSNIVQRSTSFVAPSIAANAFNRLFSRDEVYFGLFEPDTNTRWKGNVKKYAVCENSDPDGIPSSGDECTLGNVLDATGLNAIVDDPTQGDDGLFKTTATSDWTNGADSPDGRTIAQGGSGGEITDFTTRVIYTDERIVTAPTIEIATNTTALSDSGFQLSSTNLNTTAVQHIRDGVCPDPTIGNADCNLRMAWMLGADTQNEDGDATTLTRWWFHDVLHSSPEIVTYGIEPGADNIVGTADDGNFIDKVLVATNDGGLKMINGLTGVEEWSFIPNALFNIQQALYDNTGTDHTYGIDSTPVVRVIDVNGDGTIDPAHDNDGDGTPNEAGEGDKVYIYVTQRRGGRNMYALDVTPAAVLTNNSTQIVPKLLWRVDGGAGDFSRMGQSWSEPRLGRIQAGITGTPPNDVPVFKDVLIFGGGYDIDVDGTTAGNYNFGTEVGDPNEGNGIYIIDAGTGELIFWVSSDTTLTMSTGSRTGADIVVPDMKFSIPSNVTALDTDGDNLTDRVYVGDVAGQVWRLDIAKDIDPGGSDPEGSSVAGKLASISTAGTLAEERRFYYAPAVVQVVDTTYSNATGGEFDYVLIPTGYRAHPLDRNIKDRFYAFRDTTIGKMVDSNNDNIADVYPANINQTGGGTAITNSNLVDISTTALTTAVSTKNALGWYFDFNTADGTPLVATGEKGLAAPAVFAGTLIFTSFIPSDPNAIADTCSASEGSGNAFNFNILSGNAALDWDGDGDIDLDDREYELGSGIPSEAVPIFTKEGVTVLVGTGGGAENLGKVSGLPRYRTYWYEEG